MSVIRRRGTAHSAAAQMPTRVDQYWAQFLASLPPRDRPHRYLEAFFFGTNPATAHQITQHVLGGTMTATSDLLWARETDGKPIPQCGDCSIVTNGGDDPQCVIQTTDVRIVPYDEVSHADALAYGEGHEELSDWRRWYWPYLVSTCARIGREPHEKVPLIMERFRVVYAEQTAG